MIGVLALCFAVLSVIPKRGDLVQRPRHPDPVRLPPPRHPDPDPQGLRAAEAVVAGGSAGHPGDHRELVRAGHHPLPAGHQGRLQVGAGTAPDLALPEAAVGSSAVVRLRLTPRIRACRTCRSASLHEGMCRHGRPPSGGRPDHAPADPGAARRGPRGHVRGAVHALQRDPAAGHPGHRRAARRRPAPGQGAAGGAERAEAGLRRRRSSAGPRHRAAPGAAEAASGDGVGRARGHGRRARRQAVPAGLGRAPRSRRCCATSRRARSAACT